MKTPAPATIVVDRKKFTLTLYTYKSRLGRTRVKKYEFPVTVGRIGFATKAGEYRVVGKTTKPDWAPPAWSGKDSDIIPFEDPQNPFAGAFISFEDDDPDNNNEGQGFHGTKFDPEIGTRSSHGCVRMRTKDVLYIYDKVPLGTLVVIF